ncbi:MAG: hypothetical protein Q9202_001681 [Teloschistes flavicans]
MRPLSLLPFLLLQTLPFLPLALTLALSPSPVPVPAPALLPRDGAAQFTLVPFGSRCVLIITNACGCARGFAIIDNDPKASDCNRLKRPHVYSNSGVCGGSWQLDTTIAKPVAAFVKGDCVNTCTLTNQNGDPNDSNGAVCGA